MNPGAGHARVIKSWSLGENRERLDLHPCQYGWVLITDPPAKYRSTYHNNATGRPDHHSIANCKELYRLPNVWRCNHSCLLYN